MAVVCCLECVQSRLLAAKRRHRSFATRAVATHRWVSAVAVGLRCVFAGAMFGRICDTGSFSRCVRCAAGEVSCGSVCVSRAARSDVSKRMERHGGGRRGARRGAEDGWRGIGNALDFVGLLVSFHNAHSATAPPSRPANPRPCHASEGHRVRRSFRGSFASARSYPRAGACQPEGERVFLAAAVGRRCGADCRGGGRRFSRIRQAPRPSGTRTYVCRFSSR